MNLLNESINDKGLFKAVFLGGIPGSGKSTAITAITHGSVSPRIVNVDRGYEHLLGKHTVSSSNAWELLGTQSKKITVAALENYINGMLPLIIDSTASNPSLLMRRMKLLETLGYDTMMVWIDTDLDVAIRRVQKRNTGRRVVSLDYVNEIYNTTRPHRDFYQYRFGDDFIQINNNGTSVWQKTAFKVVNQFFTSPLRNKRGKQLIQHLVDSNGKNLSDIVDINKISPLVQNWFNN